MLIKHTILYFLTRGGTGVVSFAAILIYSRLLTPEEYGITSIVLSSVWLAQAFGFRWINMSITRFIPGTTTENRGAVMSTFAVMTIIVMILSAFLVIPAMMTSSRLAEYGELVLLGVATLWLISLSEFNQDIFRSQLMPNQYGWQSLLKVSLSLLLACLFIFAGLQTTGILLGLIVGIAISLLIFPNPYWREIQLKKWDRRLAAQYLSYGMPLIVTAAMGSLINNVDRILLGWLQGTEATGMFAVADDITQQSLYLLMLIVNLAAFPLVIKAMEASSTIQVQQRLEQNIILLLLISIPATFGIILLATNISTVLLGNTYSQIATTIMPWIALSTFLQGLKTFYFDLSFQLGQKTLPQIWPVLVAAVLTISLNLFWIPRWGIMGCAAATFVAYLVAAILSWYLGHKILPLPIPFREVGKICLASLTMILSILPISTKIGPWWLVGQIICGIFVYGGSILLLNVAGVRDRVLRTITLRRNTG